MDLVCLTERLCLSFTLSSYLHVSVNQLPFILFPVCFWRLHASSVHVWTLVCLVLFRYRIPALRWWMWSSGTSSYLYIFLSALIINLPVCLCPIFPYLPAVILCFVSFICGSHQTLAPDWFSCEQGCSGGPGTSSPGFEAPSHPVHRFSDPPPQHTHKNTHVTCFFNFPLRSLSALEMIKRHPLLLCHGGGKQTLLHNSSYIEQKCPAVVFIEVYLLHSCVQSVRAAVFKVCL